ASTSRSPTTNGWAGDVWKLLPILQEFRPDLNLNVVAVRPTGLGIVTNLDPSSTTLHDHYDEIVSKYLPLGYEPWSDALGGRWPRDGSALPRCAAARGGQRVWRSRWCGPLGDRAGVAAPSGGAAARRGPAGSIGFTSTASASARLARSRSATRSSMSRIGTV